MALAKERTNRLGLALPHAAVKRLMEADIRCTPEVSLEHQRTSSRYVLRGRESGGAVKALGRYISFCAEDGQQLAWFMRPDSLVANGDHAIVIAPALVSIEMFRFERTYELLITRHVINQAEKGKRPAASTHVIFRGWQGQLPLDLIEKDKALAGTIAPEFFDRAGEPRPLPAAFVAAIHAVTGAVNCLECRHAHLLIPKLVTVSIQVAAQRPSQYEGGVVEERLIAEPAAAAAG